jgi:HrpA-like RNA helicase
MPQYLLEAGMVVGHVAVTQPRRVAAVSVAQRVAEEIGCPLGDLVNFIFVNSNHPKTRLVGKLNGLKWSGNGMVTRQLFH